MHCFSQSYATLHWKPRKSSTCVTPLKRHWTKLHFMSFVVTWHWRSSRLTSCQSVLLPPSHEDTSLSKDTSSRGQPPLSVQGSTIQLYLKQTGFLRHISAWRERTALNCRQSPQHPSKITSADIAHSFLSNRLPESSRLVQELTHSYTGGFICRTTRFPFCWRCLSHT